MEKKKRTQRWEQGWKYNCQNCLFAAIYFARLAGTPRWSSSFSICKAAHGAAQQHVVVKQSSIRLP